MLIQTTCCTSFAIYSKCIPVTFSLPQSVSYYRSVDVSAYLVIVRVAIHGRLLVELVSRPRVLPHYSIEVSHTAHVHTLVMHHPCSCLHGVIRRVSLQIQKWDHRDRKDYMLHSFKEYFCVFKTKQNAEKSHQCTYIKVFLNHCFKMDSCFQVRTI